MLQDCGDSMSLLQGLTVEPQTILDVSGAVPEAAVTALLAACKSNSFQEVQKAITNTIADGFPVHPPLRRSCICCAAHHCVVMAVSGHWISSAAACQIEWMSA